MTDTRVRAAGTSDVPRPAEGISRAFPLQSFLLFLRQHLPAPVGPSCGRRLTSASPPARDPLRAGGGTRGPSRLAGAQRSGSSCAASGRAGSPGGPMGAGAGQWLSAPTPSARGTPDPWHCPACHPIYPSIHPHNTIPPPIPNLPHPPKLPPRFCALCPLPLPPLPTVLQGHTGPTRSLGGPLTMRGRGGSTGPPRGVGWGHSGLGTVLGDTPRQGPVRNATPGTHRSHPTVRKVSEPWV